MATLGGVAFAKAAATICIATVLAHPPAGSGSWQADAELMAAT
jgi:hypothetical protein